MGMLETAREILQAAGPAGLLVAIANRVLSPVVEIRCWFIFEADLSELPPRLEARVPLEIRPATVEDVDRFPEIFRAARTDRAEVGRRLDSGDVLLLALSGDQATHLHWLTFASLTGRLIRLAEIGADLLLQPGEAYLYGAYTLARWRGQRIHPAVASYLSAFARARGCTHHFSYARSVNLRTLKTLSRVQRRKGKTVCSVRIWGVRRPLLLGVTFRGRPPLTRADAEQASVGTIDPGSDLDAG